jgi:voltage-gated potassium channel
VSQPPPFDDRSRFAAAQDTKLGDRLEPHPTPWRARLYHIIFEADTFAGKAFDVALLVAILASVLVVMLETVQSINDDHGPALHLAEWIFTVLFTVEYILRLLCVRRPLRYVFSFFGIVDLLAVLPTFLSLLLPGAQELLIIRSLRLLRIFRVFKLARYLNEATALRRGLWHARQKIIIFLFTVMVAVSIIGAAMHLVEGRQPGSGFTSIPESVYWAVITMTTVGYGDITPVTPLGKALAIVLIIVGYSLIVVPTGIVSAEMARQTVDVSAARPCPACGLDRHDEDALHCKRCGEPLTGGTAGTGSSGVASIS